MQNILTTFFNAASCVIPLEHVQGCGIRFELISCVTFPRCYDFTSKRFKTRSEQESEKAVREAKIGNE